MTDHFKLDLTQRPRRLRRTASLRAMVEETVLRPADFVAPLFVIEGKARRSRSVRCLGCGGCASVTR